MSMNEIVTVEGNNVEDLLAELASALRTTTRPVILVVGYGGVPRADMEIVLRAAASLPDPRADA